MNTSSFYQNFSQFSWDDIHNAIYSKSKSDVEAVLRKTTRIELSDFMTLLSPAAEDYSEQLSTISRRITQQRFGNTIQFYIPMYLSNECQNICTYCGFSYTNKIQRLTLDDQQILNEVRVIKSLGFDHILLVAGESNKTVGIEYFENAIKLIRPYFSNISLEVQPLEEEEYKRLRKLGLYSVLVYQETYNEKNYRNYHPKGKKSNFRYRLETPDRLGRAGIHKIGLGALLGLEDWRVDAWYVALHLFYLRKKYWQTKFSISFPRLRPAEGVSISHSNITDRQLTQLISAYRLFDNNIELSLSTRESKEFRDNIAGAGITAMSAGSRTDPGGYASKSNALKQFAIDDNRSPQEVAIALKQKGLEAVWKDWDRSFDNQYETHS